MREAAVVTNCDWGIVQHTIKTAVPFLGSARNLARVGIWSAANCQEDSAAASDDLVASLQVGRQVDQHGLIGYLVDMAIETLTLACVSSNLFRFSASDRERMAVIIEDPSLSELPGRAVQMESEMLERYLAELAAKPVSEANEELANIISFSEDNVPHVDFPTAMVAFKQVIAVQRELVEALASPEKYDEWYRHYTEVKASSPIAKLSLDVYEIWVDKVRRYAANRAIVLAALAVASGGVDALAAHVDPTTGESLGYRQISGGFELQSEYKVNDKPMKVFFPMP